MMFELMTGVIVLKRIRKQLTIKNNFKKFILREGGL